MRTHERFSLLAVLVCAAILSATAAESGQLKPIDAVRGTWHNTEERAKPDFIHIDASTASIGQEPAVNIELQERDRQVVVRIAGTDKTLLVATILSANYLDCYFPDQRRNFDFKRSPELTESAFLGTWVAIPRDRNRNQQEVWKIGKDSFQVDARKPEKIRIERYYNTFKLRLDDCPEVSILLIPYPGRIKARVEPPDGVIIPEPL